MTLQLRKIGTPIKEKYLKFIIERKFYSLYLGTFIPFFYKFFDFFKGNIVKLAIFDTGVTNVSVNGSVNFINDSTEDESGHGTQMAGIVMVAAVANYSNGEENADCFANGSQTTTDINGNTVNVIGTSGATAFLQEQF